MNFLAASKQYEMSPTKRKSNIGPLTTTAIKMRQLIKDETPEQREARLQNARVRMATYLANETEAQRERRLTYSRKYSKIITARRKRQKRTYSLSTTLFFYNKLKKF